MRTSLLLLAGAFALPLLHGQSEAELKRAFEGTRVVVKIEMPATKWGIDVRMNDASPIDFRQYSQRIKQYGTALRPGESVLVTGIKVKENLIEFQVGGGGYGTLFDDTADVYVPYSRKTNREKNLEKEIDRETDPRARKRMKDELQDLRSERQRDDNLAQALGAQAQETKRAAIRDKAAESGSRFNLRFENGELRRAVPTPQEIREALAAWVEFQAGGQAKTAASGE